MATDVKPVAKHHGVQPEPLVEGWYWFKGEAALGVQTFVYDGMVLVEHSPWGNWTVNACARSHRIEKCYGRFYGPYLTPFAGEESDAV